MKAEWVLTHVVLLWLLVLEHGSVFLGQTLRTIFGSTTFSLSLSLCSLIQSRKVIDLITTLPVSFWAVWPEANPSFLVCHGFIVECTPPGPLYPLSEQDMECRAWGRSDHYIWTIIIVLFISRCFSGLILCTRCDLSSPFIPVPHLCRISIFFLEHAVSGTALPIGQTSGHVIDSEHTRAGWKEWRPQSHFRGTSQTPVTWAACQHEPGSHGWYWCGPGTLLGGVSAAQLLT